MENKIKNGNQKKRKTFVKMHKYTAEINRSRRNIIKTGTHVTKFCKEIQNEAMMYGT